MYIIIEGKLDYFNYSLHYLGKVASGNRQCVEGYIIKLKRKIVQNE